jgi:predicted enzyme related to lactoylglutathione lyase
MSLLRLAPVLLVDDVAASARHFRDRLGFTIDRLDPDLAVVSRGPAALLLRGDPEAGESLVRANRETLGAPCWDVYIWVDDLDRLYDELKGRGASISRPPEDAGQGLRQLEVIDSNGYTLCFGQVTQGSPGPLSQGSAR